VARVLIVEDEESFADPLAFLVSREGYAVAVASTGNQALEEFDREGADVVLLDQTLSGMSGTEVCRQLRERSDVPVIMVGARDSEMDRVVAFELGADDYVTKPFSVRELILRLRAVLRRRTCRHCDTPAPEPGTLAAGPIRVDLVRHVVTIRGSEVHMPLKEFELLELLVRNLGRVMPRAELIERIWGSDYFGDTKTLDVHVRRLRAKIEQDPSAPMHLVNVRGLGFKLDA
jgi:two-component system, OmpR family, response regulator RegX3